MAVAIADVHRRGVERHAEHLASVIRPMWNYLGRDDVVFHSGIEVGIMTALRAPGRSRIDRIERYRRPYVPSMLEIGQILVWARSGAFHPLQAAALELLVFTCQRIGTIAGALREEFGSEEGTEGIWSVPPARRKTAERRGDRSAHVIPLPPPVWAVVVRAKRLAGDGPYLFPAVRPRRRGMPLGGMASSNLTHDLMYMPEIRATPHDIRRAFGTHGESYFRWKREDTKMILDHTEGIPSNDVTAASYSFDDRTWAKRPIMKNWVDWVETWAQRAIETDPRLADSAWLRGQIVAARARYQEAMRRITDTQSESHKSRSRARGRNYASWSAALRD
jgi:integrase